MTISSTTVPDPVVEGVFHVYETDGFLNEDGQKDTIKLQEAVYEAVRPHKVLRWGDRTTHAITRGDLIAELFPSLTGPDLFNEQDDPDLARAICAKISKDLWSMLAPGAKGKVQQLVGLNMGNGYVLVRAKLTPNDADAVYITDDRTCIERDFLAADNKQLARLIASLSDNRAMLITRQPVNAKRYAAGFEQQMKALGNAARDKLALSVEASVIDEPDEPDGPDGPDGPED
jgi:hypothetical protein